MKAKLEQVRDLLANAAECSARREAIAILQELIDAPAPEPVLFRHEDICGDEVGPPTILYKSPESGGLPYGIVDPDYARVFTQARIIAWTYGYACVMHGSFTRDLDLLLVPWTEQAKGNHEQLLRLIAQSCDLRFKDGEEDIYKAKVDFSDRPHDRVSCTLFFPKFGDRRWVDISIMPIKTVEVNTSERKMLSKGELMDFFIRSIP